MRSGSTVWTIFHEPCNHVTKLHDYDYEKLPYVGGWKSILALKGVEKGLAAVWGTMSACEHRTRQLRCTSSPSWTAVMGSIQQLVRL